MFERGVFAIGFAPLLDAFLVGDAEEPTAEFGVALQAGDVFDGGDHRFLDDVERGLLVAHHLHDVGKKRQAVALEQGRPSVGVTGFGLLTGNRSCSGTAAIYEQMNAKGEKRFKC